jgi:hypothetical protein
MDENRCCESADAFVPAYRGGDHAAVNMDCSVLHQIRMRF